MSNSFRIRTEPGVDKSLNVLIDQEFEYLEILSLKILQSQIYIFFKLNHDTLNKLSLPLQLNKKMAL